jgi:hypothetical protein
VSVTIQQCEIQRQNPTRKIREDLLSQGNSNMGVLERLPERKTS